MILSPNLAFSPYELMTMAKRQYAELGDQLRDAADEKGLSVPQLAELANVSPTGVRLAFQGNNITLDTLLALAAVLELRDVRVGPLRIVLQRDELTSTRFEM
jgi:transcriptional regulator with XRE-family HTH domain